MVYTYLTFSIRAATKICLDFAVRYYRINLRNSLSISLL